MLKVPVAKTAAFFIATSGLALTPTASKAIEDCSTSVTECEFRQQINKAQTTADDAKNLQRQINELQAAIASLQEKVTILERSENVRTIVTKAQVDKYCPEGSKAAHVPLSYRGKTGNEICAANDREEKTCQSVLGIYVTNSNGFGRYSSYNKSCQAPITHPWPWGLPYPAPNTLAGKWAHGNTFVVCCKP